MANTPKKVKDPTEVALSAIQEALNISDTTVDTSRNSIGNDMAPPTIGHRETDHIRIMALAEAAYAFAQEVLLPGGTFLCKVFQGGSEKDLLNALKRDFLKVKHVKPPASRKDSSEMYVVGIGFRG